MKYLLMLVLLIISNYAFANSTLSNSALLVNQMSPSDEKLANENVFSAPKFTLSYAINTFEYQHLSPSFWQSSDTRFSLNEVTIRKFSGLVTDNQTVDVPNLLKGIIANYHNEHVVLSLGILNNDSLNSPQEKIFIQGSLNIWAINDFNLSVQGRIETLSLSDIANNTVNNMFIQQDEMGIKKSLSITGSYTLSDNWAVSGTMLSSDLNKVFKKSGDDKKSSDNMALIGTTYSF